MTSCIQTILWSRSWYPVRRFMLKSIFLRSCVHIQCNSIQQCSTVTTARTVTASDSENLVIPDHIKDARIISLMKATFDLGIETWEIEGHVTKKPELLRTTPDQWVKIIKRLLHHGFDGPVALAMISKCPSLLKMEEETLTKGILVWVACQFGENLLLELLGKYPELISIPQKTVLHRVKFLSMYMENKRRVGKMLLVAPAIIQQDWVEMKEKIEYIDSLHIDRSEIANSGVLRLSLLDIKTRFEFLIRAGLYKLPVKKQVKKTVKNPQLEQIVNTSNIEFANKLGGMSLTEFEVFSELYKQELEENEESDSEYESEEEE